jgi:hypothetical protein
MDLKSKIASLIYCLDERRCFFNLKIWYYKLSWIELFTRISAEKDFKLEMGQNWIGHLVLMTGSIRWDFSLEQFRNT